MRDGDLNANREGENQNGKEEIDALDAKDGNRIQTEGKNGADVEITQKTPYKQDATDRTPHKDQIEEEEQGGMNDGSNH